VLPGEFARRRVPVGEVTPKVATGGHGPPVVLLCGYGGSDKPEGGHLPAEERPDEVVEALEAFLA
jgi:hypothetical protein